MGLRQDVSNFPGLGRCADVAKTFSSALCVSFVLSREHRHTAGRLRLTLVSALQENAQEAVNPNGITLGCQTCVTELPEIYLYTRKERGIVRLIKMAGPRKKRDSASRTAMLLITS